MVKFKEFFRFFLGLWSFLKVWPAEGKTAMEQQNCSRDDKKQQSNNLFAANRDQVILPNLQTENSRIFQTQNENPRFSRNPRPWLKIPEIQEIQRFLGGVRTLKIIKTFRMASFEQMRQNTGQWNINAFFTSKGRDSQMIRDSCVQMASLLTHIQCRTALARKRIDNVRL